MPLPISNSRIRLPLGQLFWREVGRNSTPLVFLHGSSRDGSQWLPLLERLGETHHCLAVDMLGFGDSERSKLHYSIQVLTENLTQYLDALRLEQVYFVGHSLGAWVAASYALQHPERVRGLILCSPLGVKGAGDTKARSRDRTLVSRFAWLPWLLRSLRPIVKLAGKPEAIDRLLARRQQLLQCPTTCDLLLRRSPREIEAEYLDPRLELLEVPALILQGEAGETGSRDRARAYAALIPDAKLRSLPEADDNAIETNRDRIAGEIVQFLAAMGDAPPHP